MILLQDNDIISNTAITVGSFDGLHLGHRFIISELIKIAKEKNLKTCVVTFEPHPRLVLPNNEDFRLLTTLEEKISLFSHLGIDYVQIIPFTKALSTLSAEEFILEYISKRLDPKAVVLGYDHKFGKDRKGSKESFEAFKISHSMDFSIIELYEKENPYGKLSSTSIRQALRQNDINTANQLLGYPYIIQGTVVIGKQLGRTIGYPTANIQVGHPKKLIPSIGVYSGKIIISGVTYKAAINIGYNPTTDLDRIIKIEAFIIDFSEDIYGEIIQLHIEQWIRPEEKFDTLESLKSAIESDVQYVINS